MADDFAAFAATLNAISVDLVTASGRAGVDASRVIRKSAADIQRDAKAFAPVDTGTLRNSISTTVQGDGRFNHLTAEIGPTVNYGGFVEFGTSRMAPRAYMGPAADRNFGAFVEAMGAIGDKVLG